jgi:glycosyltransferase involved in cell wall biosynthesis
MGSPRPQGTTTTKSSSSWRLQRAATILQEAPIRLAILGPISWRTPPRHYGAWETVVTNLTEGLVARGYDVTLFATQDSITRASLHGVAPHPYSEHQQLDAKVWEFLHIAEAMEVASEFDLIHNHYDFMPLTYSRLIRTPMLTTIHGFSNDQFRLVYRKYRESYFVSISDADRDPYLPYLRTVYNGIRLDQFTFVPEPGTYLVFLGRIHPDKGVHLAIELARRSSLPLLIAGIIQDQTYFDELIAPAIDGKQIQFLGPAGPELRNRLFGGALASLLLTTIPERFGLAMVESMATGTPVIGFDRGSVREVVAHGETGFVVNTIDEAIEAVAKVGSIDRAACRQRVETHFSVDIMVESYLDCYRMILGDTVQPRWKRETENIGRTHAH